MAESSHSSDSCKSLLPVEVKREVKELSAMAMPVFLSCIMVYLVNTVSTVFCGHLGRLELDGVALAIAVINVTCLAVGYGLASACDTLISQTFGSGNLQRVGVIVQRGIIILLLACFPCWAILMNTESILLALKQNPEVARLILTNEGKHKRLGEGSGCRPPLWRRFTHRGCLQPDSLGSLFYAPGRPISGPGVFWWFRTLSPCLGLCQTYVKIFMPAVPATFMFAIETKYLQNQGIIWPTVITGAVGNVLNVLSNYVFLFVLNLGVPGSAAANTLSQCSMTVVLFIYIRCRGLHKDTWCGWSIECLQEWDTFMHLAFPGMLMLCAEWWTYELGAFLAGLISQVELGAQSIVYELANIAYMFPIGFSVAGSVRVGNALGAGETTQAKISAKLTMACAVSVSVCLAIIIGCTKNVISYLFSNDEHIRARVAEVMVLYAPFHLLDSTAAASGSLMRGLGKQKLGAIGNLVGFYVVGFPVGVSLMFALKMGIFGLWSGLLICALLQSVFFITVLLKLNWTKVTEEAQTRAGVQVNKDENEEGEGEGGDKGGETRSSATDPESETRPLMPRSHGKDASAERKALSTRALLLQRGLTLVAVLVVLAGGIAVNKIQKK